jgi:hypothetical protein
MTTPARTLWRQSATLVAAFAALLLNARAPAKQPTEPKRVVRSANGEFGLLVTALHEHHEYLPERRLEVVALGVDGEPTRPLYSFERDEGDFYLSNDGRSLFSLPRRPDPGRLDWERVALEVWRDGRLVRTYLGRDLARVLGRLPPPAGDLDAAERSRFLRDHFPRLPNYTVCFPSLDSSNCVVTFGAAQPGFSEDGATWNVVAIDGTRRVFDVATGEVIRTRVDLAAVATPLPDPSHKKYLYPSGAIVEPELDPVIVVFSEQFRIRMPEWWEAFGAPKGMLFALEPLDQTSPSAWLVLTPRADGSYAESVSPERIDKALQAWNETPALAELERRNPTSFARLACLDDRLHWNAAETRELMRAISRVGSKTGEPKDWAQWVFDYADDRPLLTLFVSPATGRIYAPVREARLDAAWGAAIDGAERTQPPVAEGSVRFAEFDEEGALAALMDLPAGSI